MAEDLYGGAIGGTATLDPGLDDLSAAGSLPNRQRPLQAAPTQQLDRLQAGTAQRLRYLSTYQNWMDPRLQAHLATADLSNTQLYAMSNLLRKAQANVWDGFSHAFDDPVLAKKPTAALSIRRYLSQAIGPLPIEEQDLVNVQTALQKLGYGQGLSTNGSWSPEWNAEYKRWAQRQIEDQLAGKQPGGFTFGHALHALTNILPVEAIHHVVGFARAIPSAIRQVAADVAMAGGELGGFAAYPFNHQINPSRVADVAGGFVKGQTPEQYASQAFGQPVTFGPGLHGTHIGNKALALRNAGGRAFDDAATVFTLADMASAAKGLAETGAREAAKGVSMDEARRGPGVIVNTLRKGVGIATETSGRAAVTGAVVGGAAGATQAALRGESPGKIFEQGALGAALGLGTSLAFHNIPTLQNTGAWAGRLLDADGAYYKARTLLAAPYALPTTRIAGEALGQVGIQGLKTAAIGATSTALNPKSQLGRSIEDQHFLDPVNERVKALEARVPVARSFFKSGLDDVMFLLHPGEGSVSKTVGKQMTNVVDGATDSLGRVGVIGQIEHATGKSWSDLVKDAGSEERATRFWTDKLRQQAAYSYAEEEVNKLPIPPQSRLDRVELLQKYSHIAYSDPDVMDKAVSRLVDTHFGNFSSFENRLRRQITGNLLDPTSSPLSNVSKYMDAVDVMRESVIPHEADLIHELKLRVPGDPQSPLSARQLGLARLDTATRAESLNQIADLARAHAAAADFDAQTAVERQLDQWLWKQGGIDAYRLPHDFNGKLELANRIANNFAGEVYLPANAPAELTDAVDRLKDIGYKPIVGTDIGHIFHDWANAPELSGALTRRRQIAEKIGLSPDNISSLSIGTVRRQGIRSEIQSLVDQGRVRLPPYYTVDTLLGDIDRYVNGTIDNGTSNRLLRWEAEHALSLRDIPRPVVVKALTRVHDIPIAAEDVMVDDALAQGKGDVLGSLPLMTENEANRVYRAIVRGSATPPSYMMGAARLEDLYRKSMGFAGEALPGNLGERIANLPNWSVQLRNRLRFELSPYFSLRRVAKTNVKLLAEGVEPTLHPLAELKRLGVAGTALSKLDELLPSYGRAADQAQAIDDADRYLLDRDVFHLYNPREYEAYAAYKWGQAGKSDDDIKILLNKVFGYGSNAYGEGRSAAERTANFFFFPFSFDKTLYRNIGGYLLDRPAQLILLDHAMRAYHDFNENHLDGTNPLAASWWDKHVPVLQEALRLNAFAHGISAGEFGGINRPLLNMFLPQSWASSQDSVSTLKRFIPALTDFNRVVKEGMQQYDITRVAAKNAIDAVTRDITNNPRNPLNPRPAAMTPDSQFLEAAKLRNNLRKQAEQVLAYNDKNSKNPIRFPDTPEYQRFGIAGESVTKERLGAIVEGFFPAAHADFGAITAQKAREEFRHFESKYAGTDKYDIYRSFIDSAVKVVSAISSGSYDEESQAGVTAQVRSAALQLARDDPQFLKMYHRRFEYVFGPLTGVR